MLNQEVTAIAIFGKALQKKVVQEKETRGKAKRRAASTDVMSAVEERFARMKTTVVEYVDGLNEVKGRIDEVEETFCLKFATIVN